MSTKEFSSFLHAPALWNPTGICHIGGDRRRSRDPAHKAVVVCEGHASTQDGGEAVRGTGRTRGRQRVRRKRLEAARSFSARARPAFPRSSSLCSLSPLSALGGPCSQARLQRWAKRHLGCLWGESHSDSLLLTLKTQGTKMEMKRMSQNNLKFCLYCQSKFAEKKRLFSFCESTIASVS